MKKGKIESYIHEQLGTKKGLLFVVIDPLDHKNIEHAVKTAENANQADADLILIGGSTGVQGDLLDNVTKQIKENVNIPVVLFPGNIGTVTKYADAVYFMSLLNSNNPYWITRAQMLAAPLVKRYGVEPLSVGYTVVGDGGTVGWVGDVNEFPRDKPELSAAMALAAQYMGFRFFISDAGSNPREGHVPLGIVKAVSSTIDIPYIVAGGIRTPEEAGKIIKAGANAIQVGTAFEEGNGTINKIKNIVKAIK